MKGWARTEFKKFIILSSAIFGLFLLIKFLSLFASDIESSSKIQPFNSSWIKTDSLVFIKRQKRIPTSGILLVFGIHSPIIPNYQERFKKAGGRSTLYLKELNRVIDSIRATNKAISITVATDDVQAIPDEIAHKVQNIFLQKLKTRAPWGDKTPAMLQSPYENTLFLDLDTLVCGDIKPIFKLLDNFDMAVVMEVLLKQQFLDAHIKNYDPSAHFNAIFETNSGVLLYKKTKETLDFLNSVYYSHEKGSDQHYYHLTSPLGLLGKSNVRFIMLPYEYNFRFHTGKVPVFLQGPVKIVHSRYVTCEDVNRLTSPRIFDPVSRNITLTFKVDEKERNWKYILQ